MRPRPARRRARREAPTRLPASSFGSIVAHKLGSPGAKLPGYINLSPSWNDAAFQGAGCLGARFDMMKLPGYGKVSGATALSPKSETADNLRASRRRPY